MSLRLALLKPLPIPLAHHHDEFSYLLGADTFAKGRLATPPHPMRKFFETMHENMEPTYASKYPPGQAAFLAVGLRLFGDPWYGVCLSMGVLCGALCWMLQGWVPPKYALLGGLFAALQLGVIGYWVNSYWGGAVAGAGGALVIGAIPRLVRASGTSALAAAIGIFILATSRPFEGALVVFLCALALIWWAYSRGRLWQLLAPRVIVTLALGSAVTLATIGYYNWRVAGNPLKLPYLINTEQYGWSSPFWFLPGPPQPVRFRDAAMRQMWEWDHDIHERIRHKPIRVIEPFQDAIYTTFVEGSGLPLTFLFGVGVALLAWQRARIATCLLAAFMAAMLLEQFIQPHYLAPGVGLLLLPPMLGMRFMRLLKFGGKPAGLLLLGVVVVYTLVLFANSLIEEIPRYQTVPKNAAAYRKVVFDRLNPEPGSHLVMVRYAPDHDFHEELVYNDADIDTQKIVWALDFGPEEDRPLFDYYRGRNIWLVQPDGATPSLMPYPGFEHAVSNSNR